MDEDERGIVRSIVCSKCGCVGPVKYVTEAKRVITNLAIDCLAALWNDVRRERSFILPIGKEENVYVRADGVYCHIDEHGYETVVGRPAPEYSMDDYPSQGKQND
jgi:hypothetical protein